MILSIIHLTTISRGEQALFVILLITVNIFLFQNLFRSLIDRIFFLLFSSLYITSRSIRRKR